MNIPEQRIFQMKNSTTTPIPSVFSTHEESIIFAALDLIEEKRLKRGPALLNKDDFRRYLMLRFAGLTYEQGHVLYLNIDHRLLAAEVEFFGSQNSVAWDMRKVVARALSLGAEHVAGRQGADWSGRSASGREGHSAQGDRRGYRGRLP